MEYAQITALLTHSPSWLAPFPVTCAIEYFVESSSQHIGKGDLILCNEAYDHFMVVEVKQSRYGTCKLLAQMLHYRDHLKWKLPMVRVDCAAVQNGQLIAIRHDSSLSGSGDIFFTDHFQRACTRRNQLLPKTLPFNHTCRRVRGPRQKRRRLNKISSNGEGFSR